MGKNKTHLTLILTVILLVMSIPFSQYSYAETVEVEIKREPSTGNVFHPKEITINVGTTVVWTNTDTIEHAVFSGKHDKLWAGKPIAMQLIDPINTAQEWKLTVPNIRGVYAADFKLGNDAIVGEYTVTANYFGAVANDTYKLVPGALFENSPVEVKSSLTNGCVLSTELDHSNKSLKVSLLTNSYTICKQRYFQALVTVIKFG